MAEEVKNPKELRAELLANCTTKLPRLYTGMPKIPSPFGDGIPSQEFFRQDVMIGAQWLKDHPDKRPFDKGSLRPAKAADLEELEMFFTEISPTHTSRSISQLMYHLRMIDERGLGTYAKIFLNPENSQQVS